MEMNFCCCCCCCLNSGANNVWQSLLCQKNVSPLLKKKMHWLTQTPSVRKTETETMLHLAPPSGANEFRASWHPVIGHQSGECNCRASTCGWGPKMLEKVGFFDKVAKASELQKRRKKWACGLPGNWRFPTFCCIRSVDSARTLHCNAHVPIYVVCACQTPIKFLRLLLRLWLFRWNELIFLFPTNKYLIPQCLYDPWGSINWVQTVVEIDWSFVYCLRQFKVKSQDVGHHFDPVVSSSWCLSLLNCRQLLPPQKLWRFWNIQVKCHNVGHDVFFCVVQNFYQAMSLEHYFTVVSMSRSHLNVSDKSKKSWKVMKVTQVRLKVKCRSSQIGFKMQVNQINYVSPGIPRPPVQPKPQCNKRSFTKSHFPGRNVGQYFHVVTFMPVDLYT